MILKHHTFLMEKRNKKHYTNDQIEIILLSYESNLELMTKVIDNQSRLITNSDQCVLMQLIT